MKDYPEARELMVAPGKHIYSFPDLNDRYHCRASNGQALLNPTCLDEDGLAIPTTTDEFRLRVPGAAVQLCAAIGLLRSLIGSGPTGTGEHDRAPVREEQPLVSHAMT
jgi:hypothetical protein